LSLAVNEIVGSDRLSRKDAQAVAAAIEKIEKAHGRLATRELLRALVNEARSPRSPLHKHFEWDDAKAAEKARLDTARHLVLQVHIVLADMPEQPVRCFPVVTYQGKRGPLAMPRVVTSAEAMHELIANAEREIVGWRERHVRLQKVAKLAGIFKAIEKLKK
jgi:hypothetical protein